MVIEKDKGYDTNEKQGTVAIISSVPDSKERLLPLWSQLTCFHSNDSYDEIIVSCL